MLHIIPGKEWPSPWVDQMFPLASEIVTIEWLLTPPPPKCSGYQTVLVKTLTAEQKQDFLHLLEKMSKDARPYNAASDPIKVALAKMKEIHSP